MKKALSLLLVLVLVISMVPAAFAASAKDPLEIVTQPESVVAKSGDKVTFHVEVNKANVTYTWYGKRADRETWKFAAGSGIKTDTLTVDVTGIYAAYEYCCVIKDKATGQKLTTEVATITVPEPEVLAFTKQPTGSTVKVGDTVEMYAWTTGAWKYQWYYRTSATGSWKLVDGLAGYVSGAATYKLKLNVTEKNVNYQYALQIHSLDSVTKILSDAVSLNLYEDLAVVTPPQDINAEAGETVQFTIDAKGVSSYQWYYRTSETGSSKLAAEADGAKTAVLNVVAEEKRNGYQYCCIVKDAEGNKIQTDWATLSIGPAVGSEENPIVPEFVWNEEQTEATATVTVPGKTTYYFSAFVSGMELTVNGESYGMLNGSRWMPASFTITNDGAAEATYELKIAYPAGAMENPDALKMGANSAVIAAGNNQGYFFTYIAEDDGVLTITMPAGDWTYVINNMTTYQYGETQWSDSDPAVPVAKVAVSAGDVIQIMVNTYDPNSWEIPAGTLTFSAAFESLADTEIPEDVVSPDDGEA